MANKKTFDREKMYRKIMPTYYDNNFALASEAEFESDEFDENIDIPEYTTETNLEHVSQDESFENRDEVELSQFDESDKADSTVVSFPTPASRTTAEIKSAIRKTVESAPATFNISDRGDDVSRDDFSPTPAYGSFGETVNAPVNATLIRTTELERLREQQSKITIYNLTEKVILEKLDVVMENMNCCRCDRCKMDVVALTLNNMDPYYIVRGQNSPDYSKLEKEIADKATKAVLKSAIKVRKNPRH